MAKLEIKQYVIFRLQKLETIQKEDKLRGGSGEKIKARIDEVKNMASNFGIKLKNHE